jgi:hypothetical protein
MVFFRAFSNGYYLRVETDEIKSKILDLNIIESLGKLLQSEDRDVCISAIEALSALTRSGTVKYFSVVVLLTTVSR